MMWRNGIVLIHSAEAANSVKQNMLKNEFLIIRFFSTTECTQHDTRTHNVLQHLLLLICRREFH